MYASSSLSSTNPNLTCESTTGICFGANYSILHLDIVDIPSKPCLTCTKQWCINQNLAICNGASLGDTDPDTATGKEGDVEARCFRTYIDDSFMQTLLAHIFIVFPERDSPRDQLVVTIFLLVVFGLLLGAGIKGRMVKAGLNENSFGWDAGRKWWQVRLWSFLNYNSIDSNDIVSRLSCLRGSSRTSTSWVGLPTRVWV